MKLTEEQRVRVLGHLEARGVQECAACGREAFVVGEDVLTVVAGADIVQGSLVMQGMHMVPVVCSECGHTMLFWSDALPLWE